MNVQFKKWLWYSIGKRLWEAFALTQPHDEVERLLGWMSLDCIENATGRRSTHSHCPHCYRDWRVAGPGVDKRGSHRVK